MANREILFKAKRIDNGEWVEGYPVIIRGTNQCYMFSGQLSLKGNVENRHFDFSRNEVDPSTLCQYTGMTDKSRHRIWENDIVRAWSAGECAVGKIKRRIDGLWIIYPAWQKNEIWHLIPNENRETTVEVIGNVFGNSELLKGGAEQ